MEQSVVLQSDFQIRNALSQSIDFLVLLKKDFRESLDFFVSVLQLTNSNLQLSDFLSELNDKLISFSNALFQLTNALSQVFQLLSQLNDLFFEQLLFTELLVNITFSLRSLDTFVVELSFEFKDTLSKNVDEVLEFTGLLLISVQVNNNEILFLSFLAETFDFSSADDNEFLQLSDFFLQLRNLSRDEFQLVEFKG